MPKSLFQGIVFTLLMVVCMLFCMISYNVFLGSGSFSYNIFIIALMQLPLLIPITFIIDFFLVAPIVRKIAHKVVNVSENPLYFIFAMSGFTVLLMCPIMSGVATLLFKFHEPRLLELWLKSVILNYPVAFAVQFILVGPFVRFIFRMFFPNPVRANIK